MVLANIPSCELNLVHFCNGYALMLREKNSKVRKHVTLMVPYRAPYVTLTTSSLV